MTRYEVGMKLVCTVLSESSASPALVDSLPSFANSTLALPTSSIVSKASMPNALSKQGDLRLSHGLVPSGVIVSIYPDRSPIARLGMESEDDV